MQNESEVTEISLKTGALSDREGAVLLCGLDHIFRQIDLSTEPDERDGQTCANQIDDGDRQSVREHSERQAADAEGEGISRLLDAIDVRKLRSRCRFLEHRVRLDDTKLGGVSLNCERNERECDMRRHAEQQGSPDRQ